MDKKQRRQRIKQATTARKAKKEGSAHKSSSAQKSLEVDYLSNPVFPSNYPPRNAYVYESATDRRVKARIPTGKKPPLSSKYVTRRFRSGKSTSWGVWIVPVSATKNVHSQYFSPRRAAQIKAHIRKFNQENGTQLGIRSKVEEHEIVNGEKVPAKVSLFLVYGKGARPEHSKKVNAAVESITQGSRRMFKLGDIGWARGNMRKARQQAAYAAKDRRERGLKAKRRKVSNPKKKHARMGFDGTDVVVLNGVKEETAAQRIAELRAKRQSRKGRKRVRSTRKIVKADLKYAEKELISLLKQLRLHGLLTKSGAISKSVSKKALWVRLAVSESKIAKRARSLAKKMHISGYKFGTTAQAVLGLNKAKASKAKTTKAKTASKSRTKRIKRKPSKNKSKSPRQKVTNMRTGYISKNTGDSHPARSTLEVMYPKPEENEFQSVGEYMDATSMTATSMTVGDYMNQQPSIFDGLPDTPKPRLRTPQRSLWDSNK